MKGHLGSIVPAQFPELKMLVWNRDPTRPIDAEEAFHLYERNWHHVNAASLTQSEARLIRRLTDQFGKGVFLGR